MLIRIGFEITVTCPAPVPMLLALSVHNSFAGRRIGEDRVRNSSIDTLCEYTDLFGNRVTRATAPQGTSTFWSDSIVEVDGVADEARPEARQLPLEALPHETLTYLVASRYCESDLMGEFAWKQFGQTEAGWPRVQAICDFVHNHVTFDYKFGRPDKTASNVLSEKTGVCRDFAHLAISLCRAMNIPARYASGYLGDIGVPDAGFDDFCAWFEVYLDDRWYTFDARYNVPRIGRILMVRGHDASDVAMLTSFGAYELTDFRVWSLELADDQNEVDLLQSLTLRPHPQQRGLGGQVVTAAYLTTA
ncbi:transglutaminase-like domain-containing protein [Roseibium sediminicola]|uniref:Transglutaminase family protein n=1 Tax=Roseibium sediminicola TaxID=2933272 RepID=A0ABT0GNT4_9HYPH|nr:transglutaminase family protein [Roseibium sp. CAU 1639]